MQTPLSFISSKKNWPNLDDESRDSLLWMMEALLLAGTPGWYEFWPCTQNQQGMGLTYNMVDATWFFCPCRGVWSFSSKQSDGSIGLDKRAMCGPTS